MAEDREDRQQQRDGLTASAAEYPRAATHAEVNRLLVKAARYEADWRRRAAVLSARRY